MPIKLLIISGLTGAFILGQWMPIPEIPGLEDAARNIFFHVPQSITMVFMFTISFFFGLRYLIKKNELDDVRSVSAAVIGMVFGLNTIVTGMVWADHTWGAYWNWDPRQTTFLFVLMIYFAYFALRTSVDDPVKRGTLSAAYNLFCFALLPFLIFVIPRLLPGLHPGAPEPDGANNPVITGIDIRIRLILYLSIASFAALSFWFYNILTRMNMLERQQLNNS